MKINLKLDLILGRSNWMPESTRKTIAICLLCTVNSIISDEIRMSPNHHPRDSRKKLLQIEPNQPEMKKKKVKIVDVAKLCDTKLNRYVLSNLIDGHMVWMGRTNDRHTPSPNNQFQTYLKIPYRKLWYIFGHRLLYMSETRIDQKYLFGDFLSICES